MRTKIISAWILISLTLLACTISIGGDELSDEEKLQTAVAQTITANQLQAQQQPQAPAQEVPPTLTVAPTDTQQVPPTETPKPCNAAAFVSETVPDGTELATNQNFDKTWRLQNIGTCSWNSNYQIVFVDGDKMGAPSSKNLGATVNPGETVDFVVPMKAPASAGTYKGFWKVRDDQGNYFVHNLWVEIKAKAASGPLEFVPLPAIPLLVLKPDLTITALEITPATPSMGANTHVRVRAKNEGNMDSGGFKVEWYGLDTFANPSCNWTVAGGLVADGSVWLECDFVFSSWYPVNKTTVAIIDTVNAVNESNEGNNTRKITPFGVNP